MLSTLRKKIETKGNNPNDKEFFSQLETICDEMQSTGESVYEKKLFVG